MRRERMHRVGGVKDPLLNIELLNFTFFTLDDLDMSFKLVMGYE
jgi:hypothetical protein